MGDVRAAKQQNIGELVKGLIGEEVKKPIHPFTYSPIHLKITALLRGCSMWVKPHGPRITDYGFTLLELIIVIFLITIILGLSGFFFAGSTSSQRFNSSVRGMAATLKYAKALASLDGEEKTFSINMDMKTYGIRGKKTVSIPDGIGVKVTDPVNGDIYNGRYDIVFYPSRGLPGVTIWLWDKKRTARIDTDPVAGTVVVRY